MQASFSLIDARLADVVPAPAGRRTIRHAWLNLLVFGLTILAGTWIVHQTEYTIEYGRRFSTIMATTPHRFYMAPSGFALSMTLGALLVLCAVVLARSHRRVGRLLRFLPPRLSRRLCRDTSTASIQSIGRTALILALAQISAYLLQENLEYLTTLGTLPGLAVVLAPPHATAIPLHLLVAACSSLLLWTASTWLSRSRHALGMARVLVHLASRPSSVPPRCVPPRAYLPSLRFAAGIFCLRSPPLTA